MLFISSVYVITRWDFLLNITVDNLVTAACSSIFPGGGTNQELAFHCLHEAKGDIVVRLQQLLIGLENLLINIQF